MRPLRLFFSNLQLLPGRGAVFFTGKFKFIGTEQNNFGRGIYQVALQQVPAQGTAGAVAHRQVQVRTVDGYCSREAHDFKMPMAGAASGLVGQPQLVAG